jgi:hypothetical protein
MLKREKVLLARHKAVEVTSEVIDMICQRGEVSTKKIVVTSVNGETHTLRPKKSDTYEVIKQWLEPLIADAVMLEDYTGNERPEHVKDSFHRLGGLEDLWTLFLIFDNGDII